MGSTVFRPFFQNVIKPDHLIAPFDDNRSEAVWLGGLDVGWESPTALILGRGDGSGTLHITYAAQFQYMDYPGISEVIEQHTRAECECMGVDPSLRSHDQQTGITGLQAWRALGFDPCVYPMAVRERLNFARRWLAQKAFHGGITIEHGASELHDALATYTVIFDKDGPARCTTPRASHLVDAFTYLLLRYAHMLADGTWEPGGLPSKHPAA